MDSQNRRLIFQLVLDGVLNFKDLFSFTLTTYRGEKMKQVILSIGILLLVGPLMITAWAQPGRKANKQMYSRNYDVSTVETIEGEIVEVNYKTGKRKASMGVHVLVQTDTESIPVHLGPAWYLNEQEKLEKGDRITVTGSRISYDGAPAIVAATVERNQMILRLRDRDGIPVWRGWRSGGQ